MLNPLDWPDDWIFTYERFGLAGNDEALLAFLVEMLHPEVRTNLAEVEQVRNGQLCVTISVYLGWHGIRGPIGLLALSNEEVLVLAPTLRGRARPAPSRRAEPVADHRWMLPITGG